MGKVEEIQEGNKLIAEFMELKRSELGAGFYLITDYSRHISKMQYNSSWDWQIHVWNKAINDVEHLINTKMPTVRVWDNEFGFGWNTKYHNAIDDNKPEDGFLVLVEIIKWYNSINH